MLVDSIALALTVLISIVVPFVVLGIVIKKNPMERKGIALSFCCGVIVYLIMQWALKEKGLQYLFNHTDLSTFVSANYITYLLLVALAGAFFVVIPQIMIAHFVFKKQMSFAKTTMLALGYATAEAIMLVGTRCVVTLVGVLRGKVKELDTNTVELYLSGYERILFMVIEVAIILAIVYFVEQKMTFLGGLIALICFTLLHFLPGFFLAFTMKNYAETLDRSVALGLSYVILTAAAISGGVVLNTLKYSMRDENVDSKQAVAAFKRKQQAQKEKKKNK